MSQSDRREAELQHNCSAPLKLSDAELVQENERLRQENDRLRQSEARYRQCFENSPVSILFIGADGRLIESNRAFQRLYGYTPEQYNAAKGTIFNDQELIENGSLDYMQQALTGATVQEPITYYDGAKVVSDGNFSWNQASYFPICDRNGEVQEIVEICLNHTELMKAQQTLQQERDRAAQERAQLLSTIAQVANLLLKSPDYTTVLPDVVRLLGEAVGSDRCIVTRNFIDGSMQTTIEMLATWFRRESLAIGMIGSDPESVLLITEDWKAFHQQFVEGRTANFIVEDLPNPMRSFFEAHSATSMLLVPIMVQGRLWGQIGFDNCGEPRLFDEAEIAIVKIAADSIAAAIERQAKDDELRKSEALYRSLFEISNEGIYYCNFDPPVPVNLPVETQVERYYQSVCVTKANDTLARMYGFEKGEDVIGLKLTDVHVEASTKNQAFIRALVENGHRVLNMESEEIDRNGRKCYFLNSVINQIENNAVVGGWATQIDITELREAQQALLQAERERVAQLEAYNQQLRSREHWLEATALAANALVAYPNLDAALDEALRLIGETVRCDRAAILQHIHDESGTGFARGIHEWNSQHVFPQLATEHIDFPWSAMGLEDWLIRGQAGELCGGVLDELPEPFRSIQAELDVQATYAVPIFVAGEYWGSLGIDYCREPKRLIAAEVGIFKTIASCIGSAIERQRTQEALLAAEQQRVAELAKTNRALKNSIDRLAADPDLNSFLGHVVLEITQQLNLHTAWVELYDPTAQTLQMHLLVEQGAIQLKPNLPDMGYLTQGYVASTDATWNVLLQTKQPLMITLDTLPQFFTGDDLAVQRQWGERFGIQCGINLLLTLGDEPLGLLVLFSTERTTFTREELELVEALAQQATLVIALTRLAEESRQLAIIRDRNHLAREIHDTLAQGYAGILMQIQAANFLKQQPDQAKVHLDRACSLAREGIADARRSVWLLQQDSEAYSDVSSILVQLVEQMSIGTNLKPTVTIDGTPRSVKPDLGMHLLRITQESLNNAIRHSGASAINIQLNYASKQLQILIQDNGCGFATETLSKGFGIRGMRQRADLIGAQLQIQSQPNQGTQIDLSVLLG